MTGRDYIALAAQYQADVLSGAVPACKWVKLACQRNRRDLDRQETEGFPYRFDPEKGSRVCQMAEMLPHIKGDKAFMIGQDEDGRPIWNPIQLEPWQCWILTTIFGWVHARTGRPLRRFRVALSLIPRKNAKSTLAAIVVLYMLVADGESGAECYCLDAATRVLREDFRWVPVGDCRLGDGLIGFDKESPGYKKYRKLRSAQVTSVDRITRPCYRLNFTDGRSVVASAEHRWLGQTGGNRASRWIVTADVKPGDRVRDLGVPWPEDHSRDAGYLAGIFDGEACFHQQRRRENGEPTKGDGFRITFAQVPGPVMTRVHDLCAALGFRPSAVHGHATSSAHWFGISGFYNCARFLGMIRPDRLLSGAASWYQGRTPNRGTAKYAHVNSVESLGEREVVAIGTTTKTLFAEGLFSHNSAATTRDQAKTIAEIAWEMSRRSPAFCEYFQVHLGSKTTLTLSVPSTGSKFAPLSADANSLDGLNVSFAAIDELHAHRTAAVWNVLDTATGARPQPLIFAITTAGIDVGGVCHQKMAYLEKVLEGTFVDETFFGINYTIDPGEENRLTDTLVQRKANPNYGVSVDPEDLARKVHAALQLQSDLNDKLTKHFNVWIRTESSWMSRSLWQTCAETGLRLDDFLNVPCWIGVDLAEVRDFAALVALFQVSHDTYAMFGRFYLPKAAIEKSPIAGLPGWVRDGLVIQTDGDIADFQRIEDDILAWVERFNVVAIDFDRALASQMQQNLKRRLEPKMGKDGVERFVVTVPQDTPTMDRAMKMTERLVLGQHLQHDGNEAMAWMISNVVVNRTPTTDEIRPSKAGGKDSANKIDGPVALFTALSEAMKAEPPTEPQLLIIGKGRS